MSNRLPEMHSAKLCRELWCFACATLTFPWHRAIIVPSETNIKAAPRCRDFAVKREPGANPGRCSHCNGECFLLPLGNREGENIRNRVRRPAWAWNLRFAVTNRPSSKHKRRDAGPGAYLPGRAAAGDAAAFIFLRCAFGTNRSFWTKTFERRIL